MKDTICAMCGKPVIPSSSYTRHQKYCSDDCRREARRLTALNCWRRKKESAASTVKRENTLVVDSMEAARKNISYGKLMARRCENGNYS